MPELNASGNLFTLGAAAGFDEGVVHGRVGANARATVTGEFALCHGLDAELSGRAIAELQAAVSVLLPAVRAQGAAFAAAGVSVKARVTPDLFDTFGLSAEAAAYAEASVAGRIALGLDWQDVANFARQNLSNLAYDIFIAFLNEVTAELGVWGKASFSAQATAHLDVKGSLKDDDEAGFVIEAGASAAWGGGAGWDVYGALALDNPKRFYDYATTRITRELVREARRQLPSEYRVAAELLDFALPIALHAAYELGQQAVLSALSDSEYMVEPFVDTFVADLQRYAVDKLAEAGQQLLVHAIDSMLHRATAEHLDDAQRARLPGEIEALIDDLDGSVVTFATLPPVVGRLVSIFSILAPEESSHWRQPITVVWVALAAAEALRSAIGSASASGGVVGLATVSVEADVVGVPLINPPEIVREELTQHFGAMPAMLMFHDAVDYLFDIGVAPLLEDAVPELATLFGMLRDELDISTGEVVESALIGSAGAGFSNTALYRRLRTILNTIVDGHVVADLMPAMRVHMADNPDALLWVNEVAEPCLLATSGFVFDQLDQLVDHGIPADEQSPFLKTFRSGLSALVAKVVVRNVVVFADIALHHVIGHLHAGMGALATTVRNVPDHAMSSGALTLVPALLPPAAPLPQNLADPTRDLVADLLDAGAEAFGPQVWTPDRRERLRHLMIQLLLSIDGHVDYRDGAQVEQFFASLRECAYCPDPDSLLALLGLFHEITADEMTILLGRVVPALSDFFLKLTYAQFVALEAAAQAFIAEFVAALQVLWDAYQYWKGEVERWQEAMEAAARDVADALEDVADLLDDPDARKTILDRAKLDGIDAAAAAARAVPGFGLLPADQQDDAVALATGSFVVAFDLVRPTLDGALDGLGELADGLGDIVEEAAGLPDALQALREDIAEEAVDLVNDALSVAGLSLPQELTPDTLADIAATYLTGLTALREALQEAIDRREAEKAAQRERDAAAAERDARKAEYERRQEAEAALHGDALSVAILSPLQLEGKPEDNWAYAGELEVYLHVDGARPSFVQPGAPTRILLALNGATVHVEASQWSYLTTRRRMVLRTTFSMANSPLRAGINHLECSVVSGDGDTPARASVVFAVNPNLPFEGQLAIDEALSVFDAAGDDHERTENETVTLRNRGTRSIDLTAWQLRDRARHRYVFPEVTLYANQTLAVHTGRGTNTDRDLYWGRTQAVWNNRGDLATLVDPNGVARASFLFVPEGAPR
jgi:hypothetical protein